MKARAVFITFALAGLVVLFFVDNPRVAGDILILAATFFSATFAILYAIRSNWRSTEAGRSLMYVSTTFSLLGLYLTTALWIGDYPGKDFVRLVLYWVLALAMLHRLLVWLAIQQETRDEVATDAMKPDPSSR